MASRQAVRRRLAFTMLGSFVALTALLVVAGSVAFAKGPPASVVKFVVTGLAPAAAGTVQTVRVSAQVDGKANAGYRGTVAFTSTDPQAVLPAPYTFTSKDKGTRTFSVTLKTAGTQSLTVRDTGNAALTVTSGPVAIAPAAAASLTVDGLDDAVAGTAQSVTLTLRDAYGNLATGYRGTVHFTSSDPQAVLPANTAFTAADAGSRSFSVTLKTAGPAQAVTATDVAATSLTGSDAAAVTSADAVDLDLTTNIGGSLFEGKSVATAGVPFAVTIRAVDAYGNTATGYLGSVELESSDLRGVINGRTRIATIPLTAADQGTRTITGVTLFEKRIYDDTSSLFAIDTEDVHLSDGLQLIVLPGPAVAYSACPQPLSRDAREGHGPYEDPHGPIGVNDAIGLPFTALDAWGNNATNLEPPFGRAALPLGYQANAIIQTSDAQAAFGPGGAIARFSASRLVFGPQVQVQLRTAGSQTVTITDPADASLTRTCAYPVNGPLAYRGTLSVPDPYTTTDELTKFLPFVSLPENAGPFTLTDVVGPKADTPSGLAPLGSLEAGGGLIPAMTLYWNPDDAPAGTVTCTKFEPCNVTGPRTVTYTLTDAFGNQSAGSIELKVYTTPLPKPTLPVIDGGVQIGEMRLVVAMQLSGKVVWTDQDTTGIQVDPSGSGGEVGGIVSTVTPTGAGIVAGMDVRVNILGTKPEVVTCIPQGEQTCEKGNFVDVQIIYGGNEPQPDNTTINGAKTYIIDACVVQNQGNQACPQISWHDAYPGYLDLDEWVSFQFRALSSLPLEKITYSYTGRLPRGLSLNSDGVLSGIPIEPLDTTIDVTATGVTSGASRTIWTTIIVLAN